MFLAGSIGLSQEGISLHKLGIAVGLTAVGAFIALFARQKALATFRTSQAGLDGDLFGGE